ncbi:MAG: hypothetical protein ILP02_02980, partial [Clostridia bacterium]|nr:hypothetical protein [Clostridia bacterium]
LDGVSDVAKLCNAVNTVVRKGGRLYGYNTDYQGMRYMLDRAGIDLKNKVVAILGGGATGDTAAALAKAVGAKTVLRVTRAGEINYKNAYEKAGAAQVVINATPVGSVGFSVEESLDIERFPHLEAFVDCTYNPYRTKTLIKAERLGFKTGKGLDMLVGQAAHSAALWRGEAFTRSAADAALGFVKKKTLGIVLIGMPSAGKTTIGKAISRRLKKDFYDVDALIEAAEKSTCEDLITKRGEAYFRQAETKAVKSLSSVRGAVIATGGGTILNEENVLSLKAAGVVVLIKRPLELLEAAFRPLTASRGVEGLYRERCSAYSDAADRVVTNDKTIDECVEKVIKAYEDFSY